MSGWAPIVIVAALQSASAAAAPPSQAAPMADATRSDIIVQGWRNRADLPTKVEVPTAVSVIQHRKTYEIAERMAKCAARARIGGPSLLRAVVDGDFNSATQAYAQDRLKRAYITCGESWAALARTMSDAPPMSISGGGDTPGRGVDRALIGAPVSTDPAPLGRSIFDRGAFMIEAMRLYAPDLSLTQAETGDPVVQDRFNLREVPRNRFRLPLDQRYFEVTVCMVRLQPELAVRFVMNQQRDMLDDLRAALINRSRSCVGNAKTVEVDATQFRIYIADALYRWVVAARGVSSLIPAG